MGTDRPDEVGTTELRTKLADVLNDAVLGKTTLVTSRGRVIAGVVPPTEALRLWREAHPDHDAPRSSA